MCLWLAICHLDVPDFRKKGTTERFFKGVIVVPLYWLFRSPLLLQNQRFLFPTTSGAPRNGEFIIGSIASQLFPIIRWLSTTIVLYCGALCYRTIPHLSFIIRWQMKHAQNADNAVGYQIAKIYTRTCNNYCISMRDINFQSIFNQFFAWVQNWFSANYSKTLLWKLRRIPRHWLQTSECYCTA